MTPIKIVFKIFSLTTIILTTPHSPLLHAQSQQHESKYPYVYTHLLKPPTRFESIVSSIKQHGVHALWAAGCAAITTIAVDYALGSAKQDKKVAAYLHEGDTFFTKLASGPLKMKEFGSKFVSKVTNPLRTELRKNIRQKRNIAVFGLSFFVFRYLVKNLLFSPAAPNAQRLTDFITDWPQHRPHCHEVMVEVFDDLYAIYRGNYDEWDLRDDVATAYLLAVQMRCSS